MADAEAYLLTLPNELFAKVAELLDPTDLMSLRQVSKQVAAAVDASFLKRYFSRRTHVYTLHGLQALSDISSVPRLSAYVQEVELVVLEPSYSSIEDPFPFYAVLPEHNPNIDADERKRIREVGKQDWERRCEQSNRLSTAWKVENARMSDEDRGLEILTATFEALAIKGKAMKVTITNCSSDITCPRSHDGTSTYGVYQLRESLGGIDALGRQDLVSGSCDAAATILLSALARSKLLVGELSLCSTNKDQGLGMDAFNSTLNSSLDNLLECFSRLSVLEIGLGCIHGAWKWPDPKVLVGIMRAAVSLKSFRLNWVGDPHTESDENKQALFGLIGQVMRSNCLQDVSIYDVSLLEKDLTAFFMAHRGTLRTVDLEYVAICDWEHWRALLHGIAHGLNLERLDLVSLSTPYDYREDRKGTLVSVHMEGDGSKEGIFHFTSADAVKIGIQRLCQMGECYWTSYL